MHELNKKTGLSSTELSPEMSAPPLSESVQSNQSLPPGPPLTTSPSVSNPPFHDFVNVEGVDAVVKMEVGGSPLLEENKLLQQENLQLKADNSKLQRRIIVLESQPSGSSSQVLYLSLFTLLRMLVIFSIFNYNLLLRNLPLTWLIWMGE